MVEGGLEHDFEERLNELTRLAFRVAYSVLRCREDAEEVAQEALLKAYGKLRTLRKPDRFRSWLVRITWRLALDRQRSNRRRQRREQEAGAPAPELSPEDMASSTERREYVWRAINELPATQRKVLILSVIEGHDTRSAAQLMRLPPGTVKSRLHRARRTLLEKLRWIAEESRNT